MAVGEIVLSFLLLLNVVAVTGAALYGRTRMGTMAGDIHKIEVATNSLVSRLVASTKSEAHAAGVKEGEDNERETERKRPR